MNTEQKLTKIREKCVELLAKYPPCESTAGWKATIAAIDAVVKLKKEIDCGWKTMCLSIGIKDYEEERDFWPEHADKIIAAWEGLV